MCCVMGQLVIKSFYEFSHSKPLQMRIKVRYFYNRFETVIIIKFDYNSHSVVIRIKVTHIHCINHNLKSFKNESYNNNINNTLIKFIITCTY